MIKRLDKKELERRYLVNFREAFNAFPAGVVEDDRESPDFIVVGPERVVGIELRRLFRPDLAEHGGSMRAQESLQFAIMNHLRAIYEALKLPPIDVHVLFQRSKLRKSDTVRYAKAIAGLIENRILSGAHDAAELNDDEDKALHDLPGVARIHIMRSKSKENFFAPSMASVRPRVGIDYIQGEIDTKNAKLPQYDPRCSENWLLLTYAREGLPAMMSFAPEVFGHLYKSGFQRVFLFGWREELFELSVLTVTH